MRAGVALYGVSPDSHISSEELGLIPAMTLSAKIIAVQEIAPGEAVGYGSRWIAKRPTRVGIVACGYADGYPRSMPDGSPTWVEGAIRAARGRRLDGHARDRHHRHPVRRPRQPRGALGQAPARQPSGGRCRHDRL